MELTDRELALLMVAADHTMHTLYKHGTEHRCADEQLHEAQELSDLWEKLHEELIYRDTQTGQYWERKLGD